MKLGTQTNSFVNHMYSRAVIGQPEPTVGMGVTMLAWTDRYAGTIVAIEASAKGGMLVHVTRDEAKVVAGTTMDGSAEYEYSPNNNPNAARYTFRREADGKWAQVYQKALEHDEEGNVSKRSPRWSKYPGGGKGLRIGEREEYCDPSF